MPEFSPLAAEPQHIAISKSKGIRIDWRDGHHSEYELRYLRDHCPCATCAGAHVTQPAQARPHSPFQLYEPPLKMIRVEPAGSYAVQIQWNDGHCSGIYSYDYLRGLCPCSECSGR